MTTTGKIDDDNGTNGWWQPDILTSGQIDDENGTISWRGGDKFTMTTGRLTSGRIEDEERMPWRWRGEKLTMTTRQIDNDDRTNQRRQGNNEDDEGVLNCNHVHCDGHDRDGSRSWLCLIAITLAAMVLSHDGAQSHYIVMCLQHHDRVSSKIIARMGRPILALVPVLDRCQFGVTRLLSSSSTGHPVLALGATCSHFWSQFQHWAPHGGTVPVWGRLRPSSNMGQKIGPSSSTGPVPIWGLTYILVLMQKWPVYIILACQFEKFINWQTNIYNDRVYILVLTYNILYVQVWQ